MFGIPIAQLGRRVRYTRCSMNRRTTIVLCAFGAAFLCALLVYRIHANALAAAHGASGKRVVAAAVNVQLGTILKASDLKVVTIGEVPAGAFLEKDKSSLVGRGVTADLTPGEPILETLLAAAGSGGGLAAAIPNGMRACAVKVDEVVGVSGFVTPGMHVDVIVSGNPPTSTGAPSNDTQVRTLLQDLKVLSAGTDFQKDAEGKAKQVHVVNLLVTPDQAETLSLASNQTHIQLVLRNPLDANIAKVPGNALGNFFGATRLAAHQIPARKATKKEPTNVYTVEVVSGSKTSVQTFAPSEGK